MHTNSLRMSQVENSWVVKPNSGKTPCKEITISYMWLFFRGGVGQERIKKKIFILMCYIYIEYPFYLWPKKIKKYTFIHFACLVSMLIFRENSLANKVNLFLLSSKWVDKEFVISSTYLLSSRYFLSLTINYTLEWIY